ncbi:hypothetical protein PT974_09775 [Cladobotryum mycophilum]|uniref:Uncharacterized protein n=1 Tax=Cladobotryum mycophilum TaxID=491253 RepID=A0ABR0SH38_9HYPO
MLSRCRFKSLSPVQSPVHSPVHLSKLWHYAIAQIYDKSRGPLPDPVETMGEHLITAPSTPTLPSRPNSKFAEDLASRLKRLEWQQSIRRNMYGEDTADDIPIGRTPTEVKEKALADSWAELQSPSDSESEQAVWHPRVVSSVQKSIRHLMRDTPPRPGSIVPILPAVDQNSEPSNTLNDVSESEEEPHCQADDTGILPMDWPCSPIPYNENMAPSVPMAWEVSSAKRTREESERDDLKWVLEEMCTKKQRR